MQKKSTGKQSASQKTQPAEKSVAKNPTDQRRKKKNERQEVQKANKGMREAWKLGKQIAKKTENRGSYRENEIEKLAKKQSITAMKAYTYRAIYRRMQEDELKELCAYCLERQRALGPTFLGLFVRLDEERRKKFWQQAVDERWSVSDVRREVGRRKYKRKRESSSRVGRKRNIDWTSELDLLNETSRLCESWQRFAAELGEDAAELEEEAGLELLSETVQKRLKSASKEMTRLANAVREELDKLGE